MAEIMRSHHDEPWIPEDNFGARLAVIRTALRLNVKQAAAQVPGVSDENWRQWERGRSPRDMDVQARRIAEALNVDYVWLLTGVRTGSFPLITIPTPPQLELPFHIERELAAVG